MSHLSPEPSPTAGKGELTQEFRGLGLGGEARLPSPPSARPHGPWKMTSNASLSGLGSGQGRPGLAAHYCGREGRFPPLSLLLPPSPPFSLASLLQGQARPS